MNYSSITQTLYNGDLQPGDRAATPEEISAWELSRAKAAFDAKLAAFKTSRDAMLNRLSGIAFAANLAGENATVTAFLAARQGLLDITKDLPTEPQAAELLMAQRYMMIVATAQAAAPTLVSAFAAVDA